MSESPMKDHVLGIAARYNDADAEEHGFEEVISRQGLTLEDLHYLAQQRAMRALYVVLGKDMEIFKSPKPIPFPILSAKERWLFTALTTAELDGMMIGWRAAKLEMSDRASH